MLFEDSAYIRLKLCGQLRGPYGCSHCLCPPTAAGEGQQRHLLLGSPEYPSLQVEVRILDILDVRCPHSLSQPLLCVACRVHHAATRHEAFDIVLIDPSCSGSGLPLHNATATACKRIARLADFQTRIFSHTLQLFSDAKTVCYSTCSIHAQENEEVVLRATDQARGQWEPYAVQQQSSSTTECASKEKYLGTRQRQPGTEELYDLCFHSDPTRDQCRGFFLAKLVRKR